MSQINGFNMTVHFFPDSAASVNLTGDLTSAALRWDRANQDVTTFGAPYTVERLAGLRDWSMDFAGIWNSGTATIVPEGVFVTEMAGSKNGLILICPASITGSPIYSGCGLLTNFSITGPLTGPTAISFSMQAAAGSLTRGAVA